MATTDVDTNNPFLLVVNRLVDLIASPIDLWRAGHWAAALFALLFLLLLLAVVVEIARRLCLRRISRKAPVTAVVEKE
jgi:hypothetical protein